eukprot:scaffold63750_cov35-Phaeocystis_antarctica.AAC.1
MHTRPARREERRGSERLLDKHGHLAVVDLGSCGHASLPSSLRAAYSGWRRARRDGEVLQGAVLISLQRPGYRHMQPWHMPPGGGICHLGVAYAGPPIM